MFRGIFFRSALLALLTVAVLPAAFAQDSDSQSVAEAARRAKRQKKPAAKPAKVFTDDDVKPASPSSAADKAPAGSSDAATSKTNASALPVAGPEGPEGEKKEPKEVTALKEQIKRAESDLDLQQRELRLDQEALYSKTDYASDKAGLAKIEDEKQQVAVKQQEIETLKAKLADLRKSLNLDDRPAPPRG